jgi:hypothetical protein
MSLGWLGLGSFCTAVVVQTTHTRQWKEVGDPNGDPHGRVLGDGINGRHPRMILITERPIEPTPPAVADVREARRTRGRPKGAEAGNRFHISIPESLTKRLSEIQHDTHATSITEVVKNALQLYAAAVEEHKKGGAIYFKRKDEGVERQLALFI